MQASQRAIFGDLVINQAFVYELADKALSCIVDW